jgi:RNA polymerase sigma-B factor
MGSSVTADGRSDSPRFRTSASPGQRERVAGDRALLAHYKRSGDARLRDAIVERFLPLARRLAQRYARSSEPFDDLMQVACLGLVKAVDRFDPERGVTFSSYAVPTILGEIKRHFRDRTWTVRVPRDLQELTLAVEKARTELEARLERSPTVSEVAEAVEAGDEDVLEALAASRAQRASSLEAPLAGAEDDSVVADAVGCEEHGFKRAEQRATLRGLLAHLPIRDREIVRLRYVEDLTQDEIGARVGVSQMQVSRILRSSVQRMRAVAGAT